MSCIYIDGNTHCVSIIMKVISTSTTNYACTHDIVQVSYAEMYAHVLHKHTSANHGG